MKQNTKYIFYSALVLLLGLLTGCAGTVPFPGSARAGDTIMLYAGWKQKFDRNSLTTTITGADSSVVTYAPGDPAVRAVINLYPDPLSYLAVGTRIGSNDRYGSTYGSVINNTFTGNDPDWWQTAIYLNLPASLPVGTTEVSFQSSNGESYGPIPVEIIPGQGSPSGFNAEILGPMSPVQMQSMEREPSYTVKFSGGSTLPSAIQIDLTHNPDSTAGGTGKTFVVNPRGEMKNLTWRDTGTSTRVLLLTSGDGTSRDPYFNLSSYGLKYFKFYITGGVTGFQVQSVKAYDSAGNPISGVTATVN